MHLTLPVHGHITKLTADNLRRTFSQSRKKFEILTPLEIFGNTNKIKKTLYKERDFRKIYLSITLEKFDRRVTGQSGCELKIAKTRFGHKTIRSPFFFLFSQNWLKVYTLYTLWKLFEEIKKKFVWAVSEMHKNLLKVQILNEVALRQVVKKRVSFHDRMKENTPKFPSNEIWY